MADRIERYLGKLEAELDGRVSGERLEGILLEVEGHLRESEDAYRELGEPDELANRLAVEGFGGVPELTVQIEHGEQATSRWVSFWERVGFIGGFVSVVGLVVATALISSMSAAFWLVGVPGLVVLFSAFFVQAGGARRVMQGGIAASVCLLIIFMAAGRASFTNGEPMLGLNLGGSEVLTHGSMVSSHSAALERDRADKLVAESEGLISWAHDAPPSMFAHYSPNKDGQVLLINVYSGGYSYRYTPDYMAARESWLKFGDPFLAKVRESAVLAKKKQDSVWQLEQSALKARWAPVVVALSALIGISWVVLAVCCGVGYGLRKVAETLERVLKKVGRYGIQK